MSIEINNLFREWLHQEETKLKKNPVNLKEESRAKRAYIHFDKRRHLSSLLSYKKILLEPVAIAKTSFWPFIKIVIKTPRYKKVKTKRKIEIKKRPVYYAAHKDALIYSWYSFLLNEKYYNEKLKKLGIDKCVFAYRKIPIEYGRRNHKCNIHFAKEVFDYISSQDRCVAIVADITHFFDSLDHEHLKREWISLLDPGSTRLPDDHFAIYKNLTKFKYVEAEKIFEIFKLKYKEKIDKKNKKTFKSLASGGIEIEKFCSRSEFVTKIVKGNLIKGNEQINAIEGSKRFGQKCGIMQGSPISAALSNIYMTSFDVRMNSIMEKIGGIYRRYSDDIVVVCSEINFQLIRDTMLSAIKEYELEINPCKTETTFFFKDDKNKLRGFGKDESNKFYFKNLQYLGFEFDGQNVFVRSSSVSKYYRKMKSKTKKAVNMAWGKHSKTKQKNNEIFKKTLYKKYLYKGRRSFISYALRAGEIMQTKSIRKQLSKRFDIIKKAIEYRVKIKEDKKAKRKTSEPLR